jgi:hypothetical protein
MVSKVSFKVEGFHTRNNTPQTLMLIAHTKKKSNTKKFSHKSVKECRLHERIGIRL